MSFVDRLAAVVRARPQAVAVEHGDVTFTYDQLWRAASAAAAGRRPGQVVVIEHPRSPAWIVDAIACWIAGAAFAPLPPGVPAARRRAIEGELAAAAVPAGLAYVVYTSGSSGRPRGVMVGHRGLVPMLDDQIRAFELGPGDRALWCLSPGFDASISDVGTALLAGATVVVCDDPGALPGFLRARAITCADLPPALLPLLDPETLPPCLRTIVIGGEVCPPHAVRAHAARRRVINVYGPTEATVCCSLIACGTDWSRPLLGRAIGAAELAVEDGELWIGGDAVALGYLGDPEQTAARFVGGRFRTGDRVRRHPGGELEFLGRTDRQRKVRGNLVCPEEIEHALLGHRQVAAARVDIDDAGRITAAIEGGAGEAELRAHLAERLPAYMVPHRWLGARLARGAAGKPVADAVLVARLASIWQRVLGREVGPDDDFAAVGGDSLTALEIAVAAAGEGLHLAPPLVSTTPRELAATLGAVEPTRDAAHLRRLAAPTAAERARAAVAPAPAIGTVLLTGATGRLGARVLAAILDDTDWRVVCLTRGGDRLAPHPRVREIDGDLEAMPRVDGIDAVIHCAARVNTVATYDELAPVNVGGTRAVASLGVPIHYASTLSVFVATDRNRGIMRADDTLDRTREVYGGYAQTKYVAERFVRELGAPATIHRFGLLVGDGDDFLAAFVRGVRALGCVPAAGRELALDLTPVDVAARAMVSAIAAAPAEGVHVHHVANRVPATLADLAAAIGDLAWVDDQSWRARALTTPAGSAEAAAALALCRVLDPVSFAAYRALDLFQATGADFASDVAMAPAPDLLPDLIRAILGSPCRAG